MKKFGIAVLILASIIGFLSWGYGYQFNAKVTVTVDTPDGIKTGSSVVSYRVDFLNEAFGFLAPLQPMASNIFKGEAVVVDLGNRNHLFALLNEGLINNASRELFFKDIYADYTSHNGRNIMGRVQNRINEIAPTRKEVPFPALDRVSTSNGTDSTGRDHYPLLVTFGDISDPASVKRVDPANFEAAFGPGYKLNTVTLSITDEPVTKGNVEKVLGWLGSYYDKSFDGNRIETREATNRLANSLASGSFDTEKN